MRKLWLIFVFVMSVFQGWAQENIESVNERAATFYKNGKYSDAASVYESMLKNGQQSADVYYNLGNSYYKNEQIALSILNYERALLLSPNMEDAQENLLLANAKKQDKIEVLGRFFLLEWIDSVANCMSSNVWAIFSVVFFIILLLLIFVYAFFHRIFLRKVGFYGAIICLFFFILSFSFAYKQKLQIQNREYAIIMAPSVTVNSTPDERGTKLFVLHEGVKVKIKSTLDKWAEIRLSDGSVGWILLSDVERI